MPPFIDLKGQRFNRLTVLKRLANAGKHVVWKCQCDCGRRSDVRAFSLKDGSTISCGCYATEVWSGPHPERRSKIPLIQRFESRYIPEPNSGCWLWLGALRSNYAYFEHEGGNLGTHYSFKHFKRKRIPKGHLIRHTCDNTYCVNPDHLLSGTTKDNSDDARKRNRMAVGERINTAKLSSVDVVAIRQDSRSLKALAEFYGVTKTQIWHVKKRISWKHI